MIIRNEADRFLLPCLEHLLAFVDEVRVLDDGSTDGWWEKMMERVGDKASRIAVLDSPASSFYEHEGRARQRLLEWTLEARPSYILAIDADEFIADPVGLLAQVGQGWPSLRVCMQEVWGATRDGLAFRMDGGWGPHDAPIVYACDARNTRTDLLRIPDRKLASGRVPPLVARRSRSSGVGILHFGWACKADREARYQRYVEHDGGNFHQNAHLESIMWDDDDPRLTICRDGWPKALLPWRDELVARCNRNNEAER